MATISDKVDFDAEAASQSLRDAMSGLGTDENELISVLVTHSNWQMQEIRTQYTAMFGRDLIDDLLGETKGYFEEACVALARERFEFIAHLVHDALSGAGTSEQIIIDIMGTITPYDIDLLKEKYEELFEKKMQDDITSDLSGYFERFLVSIMSSGRAQDEDVDYDLAQEDAQRLYDAGEGSFGTDECVFMSIFMTRSWNQLKCTCQSYQDLIEDEEKTILNVIDKEFSGSEQKLLQTIAKFAVDPIQYYSDVLLECMQGIGTSDRRLFYTIIRRCEIDLQYVKEKFSESVGEELGEKVSSEVGGDLDRLLQCLILGNESQ